MEDNERIEQVEAMVNDSLDRADMADNEDERFKALKNADTAASVLKKISSDNTGKQKWLDTPIEMTTREMIVGIVKAVSIPFFGFLGVVGAAEIKARSDERINERNIEARRELLQDIKRAEQDDIISTHQLDILNKLK